MSLQMFLLLVNVQLYTFSFSNFHTQYPYTWCSINFTEKIWPHLRTMLDQVTFKSNVLQNCVTPKISNLLH